MQNLPSQQRDIRAHVLISGMVQGVGYRFSTMHEAKQLRLSGWVRNLPDGRVEAVFEGSMADVSSMLQWCHKGPRAAVVKDVAIEYQVAEGLRSFEIRR